MVNDIIHSDVIVGDVQGKSDIDYNDTVIGTSKKGDIIEFSNRYSGKTGCELMDLLKTAGTPRNEEEFTGITARYVQ